MPNGYNAHDVYVGGDGYDSNAQGYKGSDSADREDRITVGEKESMGNRVHRGTLGDVIGDYSLPAVHTLHAMMARLEQKTESLVDKTHKIEECLGNLQTDTPLYWKEQYIKTAKKLEHTSSRYRDLLVHNSQLQVKYQQLQVTHLDCETRVRTLQSSCNKASQQLCEEQEKCKQLEQEHVTMHQQQTSSALQIDQLEQRIRSLENKYRAKPRPSKPLYQRPQQIQQDYPTPLPLPSSRTFPSLGTLPSPRTSPSISAIHTPHNSFKEEGGYLVFDTHMNGELVHCRVKIPGASEPMRSPHQRPLDYPWLVTPPITRAASPQCLRQPLGSKKALNPNAPEWHSMRS
ncbi:hypothetical protein BDF14DRAFT_1333509 [Spinellus fusiger]|nr:hypothetical protein BDF14DRAFT_1333509 [Spinellus fusiger]